MRVRWRLAMIAVAAFAAPAVATDPLLTPDVEAAILRALELKPGDADLVARLVAETPPLVTAAEVDRLVADLASPIFAARDNALRALVQGGLPVAARLRAMPKPADAEAAQRVETALARIEAAWPPKRVAAYRTAARLVAARRPAGCEAALLGSVPTLADDDTLADVWGGLDALAARAKAVPPAPAAAAGSADPDQRALAAFLLGRRGDAGQRAAGRTLLADPDPGVRLRAAQGVLGAGDVAGAVPTLVALLDARPLPVAWQAEELLSWAGGYGSPADAVGDGSAAAAAKRQWERWWADARSHPIAWPALVAEPRRQGLFLLADAGNHPGPSTLDRVPGSGTVAGRLAGVAGRRPRHHVGRVCDWRRAAVPAHPNPEGRRVADRAGRVVGGRTNRPTRAVGRQRRRAGRDRDGCGRADGRGRHESVRRVRGRIDAEVDGRRNRDGTNGPE